MKVVFLLLLTLSFVLSAIGQEEPVLDSNRVVTDSLITDFLQKETDISYKQPHFLKRLFKDFDEFWVGARVNYTQGKHGYVGIGIPFSWNETYGVTLSHFSITPGFDVRISYPVMVYAPKISIEYQLFFAVARGGYQRFTDFASRHEDRLFVEAGFSFFSLMDITYLHSFGFNGNPFNHGNSYLNIALTVPLRRAYKR